MRFRCLDESVSIRNKKQKQKQNKTYEASIKYTFFSLKIINPQNIHKNILKISDQNRINIKVTFLYFPTNQLQT